MLRVQGFNASRSKVQLFNCSIVLLFYCLMLRVQGFNCSNVLLFYCSIVLLFNASRSRVQRFNASRSKAQPSKSIRIIFIWQTY